jgi:uroporphyrinogen decarboxylase
MSVRCKTMRDNQQPLKMPMLETLRGNKQIRPPLWMMRQAGRYLPEYRATRTRAGGFLDLCYTPDLAVEVTLQPIRRFGFDAAILFSDILVVPDALGQDVRFEEGVGPVLEALSSEDIRNLSEDRVVEHLQPVFKTLQILKQELPQETTLLGFCGAPWTVATYMVGGRGSPDQAKARLFALEQPEAFDRLIEILVKASIRYLGEQIQSGADAVQIFDSWSGSLSAADFERYSIEPVRQIVSALKAQFPHVPIIGFPKGAMHRLQDYQSRTGVDVLGLDYAAHLPTVFSELDESVVTQGNLDPLHLVHGGERFEMAVNEILQSSKDRLHVFNLGHGITPQANIAHVERLVELVQNYTQNT